MEPSSLLSAVSEVFGLNYVLYILGLTEVIVKAETPGEVSEQVVLKKVEAAAKEDVAEVVKAADEKDVPNKVEVVEENTRAEAAVGESSADVVEQGAYGAGPVLKKGKKSFKN